MAHPQDFVPLRNKARQYQNTATGEVISLRQFQKIQRGGLTYTQFVKKKGGKTTYKTKGHTTVKIPRKTPAFKLRRLATDTQIKERITTMKESWARARSAEYGIDLQFKDLPVLDQSVFWENYHSLMDAGEPPDYEYYLDELQDYYDLDYEDWLDLSYGDTP
jgi:aryl-phospho-beta-D-glucosidase BglC (GH1 family)